MTQDRLPRFIRYVASALRKFSGQRQDNKPPLRGVMKVWHLRDVLSTLAGGIKAAVRVRGGGAD